MKKQSWTSQAIFGYLMATVWDLVRISTACLFAAGMAGAGSLLLMQGFGPQQPLQSNQPPDAGPLAAITVDYPDEGSIFPPEITPPTFLWRDSSGTATIWRIRIAFAGGGPDIQLQSAGERMRVGEIDDSYGGFVPPTLSPEQAAAHTWKPGASMWEAIKTRSSGPAAAVVITGFRDENATEAVSRGQVAIQTSTDPVGAPIFYRD